MKVALLSLALFGTELTTPISDRVPELRVEALCKARSAGYKLAKGAALDIPSARGTVEHLQ